jgi:hypothetical protein
MFSSLVLSASLSAHRYQRRSAEKRLPTIRTPRAPGQPAIVTAFGGVLNDARVEKIGLMTNDAMVALLSIENAHGGIHDLTLANASARRRVFAHADIRKVLM